MWRYVKTLGLFWQTAFAAELEYRSNFALALITAVGELVGHLFVLGLLFSTAYRPGGWTFEQALLVTGAFTFLQGITSAFLQPNLGKIVTSVQTGTLDFVLLKPISSQFYVSLRTLSPWGLFDVVFGVGISVYATWRLGLGASALAQGLLPLLLGSAILYSLWFVLCTTCIWFVKIYNATEVLRSVTQAGQVPVYAYPATYRFILRFVVPVAFLTTVPAEFVLGQGSTPLLITALLVAAGLFAFSRWFWLFALRSYTSASS